LRGVEAGEDSELRRSQRTRQRSRVMHLAYSELPPGWRVYSEEVSRRNAEALAQGLVAGGEGGEYTREQYERAAAAAGIEPLSDRGVCGLVYWSGTAENDVAVELAIRRAGGVQAETADDACSGCDRWLAPGEAMWASRGRACPDCYDDLSL
jgi:hypothetical protein